MRVAEVIAREGPRTQGMLTKGELRAAGVSEGSLARAVRAGSVVRVRPAVYATAPLPPRPRFVVTDDGVAPDYVAHVRAALASLGSSATACGRTAAAVHGWGMLVEPGRRLDVAVPHGRSTVSLPGVHAEQRRAVHRTPLVALADTAPIWVTSPLQTAVDCALRLPLLQGVVVCDSALRAGAVTVDELTSVQHLRGVRDAARLRNVLRLIDDRSGSVLESVQRVRMLLAGITGMQSQVVLRACPELRVDFCHLASRLVVEVDGRRWHPDPARDQARDNALVALGWRVLRFTWQQVVHESEHVLEEIQAALATGPDVAAAA